jgi:hypothetical protein
MIISTVAAFLHFEKSCNTNAQCIHSNGILFAAGPGMAIWGIRKARCGGVTFVQRFGGTIDLNIHFHSLVMDGVYYDAAFPKLFRKNTAA